VPTALFLVISLGVLLLFSAYMSATETSLFSLSNLTLKNYHFSSNNRKKLVYHLLLNPRELLVTLLMLNVFANIVVQNVVSSLFQADRGWLIRVLVPLGLTLTFGEVIPKSLALPNNEKIALRVAPSIAHASRILGPFRRVLTKCTSAISRILFFFLKSEKEISQDELEEALKGCLQSKVLSSEEFKLMDGYLHLKQATVKELMCPREDICYYDLTQSPEQLITLFVQKKCKRVPVCEGGLENVLGILSFRHYFSHLQGETSAVMIKKYVLQPLFVPETLNAWTFLHDLREKKEDTAIVIDEYGSISGLVTKEDLISSVIGDVVDLKEGSPFYTRSGDDIIIASGKLEITTFEEIFHCSLQNPTHAVTIGGWLIGELGDIPSAGARYVNDDFLFYVLAADPNRIKRVYIRRLRGN
jgi:putative hemolysin